MARRAAAGFWSLVRACARAARRCAGGRAVLAAAVVLIGFAGGASADPVKGEATFATANGYARLLLKLAEDVGTEVTTAGSIVVIRFNRPVDVPIDRLAEAAPDYVGSVRRDPDGSAIRMSLTRRGALNTMAAGGGGVVGLLPGSWGG